MNLILLQVTSLTKEGEKCNLLTTEPEMLGNASFRGNEFYGYIVIEFKLQNQIFLKFCPDPTAAMNGIRCSVRVDKTSCSGSINCNGNSIRFISDDSLCRTRYEPIKPYLNC